MPAPKARSHLPARRIAAATLGACALAASFLAPCALRAQVFLRGDANSDGRVSVSDMHFILAFLFGLGELPQCEHAADVQADRTVDGVDAFRLLGFLLHGRSAPCEPFPEPGEDPLSLFPACGDYRPTPPAADPRYVLELSDAIAGVDGITTITVFVTNPAPIAACFGKLVLEVGRFGAVRRATNVSELAGAPAADADVLSGKIHFVFVLPRPDIEGARDLAPGERQPLLQIECCLEPGLAAGDYEVSIEDAEVTDFETSAALLADVSSAVLAVPKDLGDTGCTSPPEPAVVPTCERPVLPQPPDLPGGPELDFVRRDVNLDGRVSLADALYLRDFFFDAGPPSLCSDAADANDDGRLDAADVFFLLAQVEMRPDAPAFASPHPERGPDPTPDALGCVSEAVTPAVQSDDFLGLGIAVAAPGGVARVPVVASNTVAVGGFQVVLRADPSLLSPPRPGAPGLAFDGSYYEALFSRRTPWHSAVRSIPGEPQAIAVTLFPDLGPRGFEATPENPHTVCFVLLELAPSAPPGSVISLELSDGAGDAGSGPLGLVNELSSFGMAQRPRLGRGGEVRVVEPQGPILRGDASHDGQLDLSDSVLILNRLFLGGPPPVCPDEADVNDNGTVDIADPIALLGFLFLGERPPRPPFPEPGVDPTPDSLPECFE
jgi:hypothetical protein